MRGATEIPKREKGKIVLEMYNMVHVEKREERNKYMYMGKLLD